MAQETLAARIRAKYPGVYDDLDDVTLEQKVRAKFPGVYDDLPRSTATTSAKAPAPLTFQDTALGQSSVGRTLQGLHELGTGVVKGAANTITGLGEAFYNYVPGVAAVTDATQRAIYGDVQPGGPMFTGIHRELEPTTPLQQVGKAGEQMGEFLIPAAAAEKTAAVVTGKLAPYVAPVVARVLPRTVLQGVTSAGTAVAQGQDPVAAGVVAAAVPGAGELTPRMAAALRARSDALVQAAVKPTVTALKRITGGGGLDAKAKALVRFIIDNRLTTADKARTLFQETEQELQRVLSASNTPTDAATRAQRYLEALERSAAKQGLAADDVAQINHAAAELLEGQMGRDVVTMVPTPHPTLVGPNGKPIIVLRPQTTRTLRPTVPATEALESARASSRWSTRKQWGEQKGAQLEAAKAVERAQRDAVKTAVPEARALLQTEGRALSAADVLDRMAQRAANRDALSLPTHVIAAGEIARGRVPMLAFAANWLRNNQLKAGIWADVLAKAIERKDVVTVATILGRLGVGATAQVGGTVAAH